MQKHPSDYILGSTLQTTRVDLRSRRGALAHFPKQQLIVTWAGDLTFTEGPPLVSLSFGWEMAGNLARYKKKCLHTVISRGKNILHYRQLATFQSILTTSLRELVYSISENVRDVLISVISWEISALLFRWNLEPLWWKKPQKPLVMDPSSCESRLNNL